MASSSGCWSPAPSPESPNCCCSTSRTPGSTPTARNRIAATLGERARAGASVVVVLHELGPFAPLIDRVVALRDGRVTYDGPADQLVDGDGHVHHHDHHEPGWLPPMQAPLEGGR